MTETPTELIAWLRTQLDDDELVATNHGTLSGDQWSALEVGTGRASWEIVRRGGGVVGEAAEWEAKHITRHDPARALAEVDAKRRRLALIAELATREPGLALRFAKVEALPYADQPGYRADWKP